MTNEELATAIQAGESDLMDQLWEQCVGFIRQQAIRWARAFQNRSDFDVDDLTQAGYIALCEAVRGFQKDRGGFIGFLSFHLKNEFARVAGCKTSKQEPLNYATSLDTPAYNDTDNETTLGDNIPVDDPGFENVERALMNDYLSSVLDQAIRQLPEKQRRTIELYYLHGYTYFQIAEILHCSKSFPQQVQEKRLGKLEVVSMLPSCQSCYMVTETITSTRAFLRGSILVAVLRNGNW